MKNTAKNKKNFFITSFILNTFVCTKIMEINEINNRERKRFMKKTDARYMTAVAALTALMTLSPQAKAQYVERVESVRTMTERLKEDQAEHYLDGIAQGGEPMDKGGVMKGSGITDVRSFTNARGEMFVKARVNGRMMTAEPLGPGERKALKEGRTDLVRLAERKYARQLSKTGRKMGMGMKRTIV